MTIRLINDDPRCQSPDDCSIMPRGKLNGICTDCRHAARIGRIEALKALVWSCPDGYHGLFATLKTKTRSAREARRLVEEQIEIDRRRSQSSLQSSGVRI